MQGFRRRLLIAAACIAASRSSGLLAQGRKPPRRVTLLFHNTNGTSAQFQRRWVEWFTEAGFVDGGNLRITFMDPGADSGPRFESAARDIVASRPDVIITFGTVPARVLQRLTREVPIVFLRVGDPVGAGLVESLVRPGGNLTGLTNRYFELDVKRLELLKELSPQLRRVAAVCDEWVMKRRGDALQASAKQLGLSLVGIPIPEDTPASLIAGAIRDAHVEAAMFDLDAGNPEILRAVTLLRIPVIYAENVTVENGGLISLGERIPGPGKRAAAIAARILRGENPATIPVDQISVVHLALNLRAARELGLAIPASVRLRADQIVE